MKDKERSEKKLTMPRVNTTFADLVNLSLMKQQLFMLLLIVVRWSYVLIKQFMHIIFWYSVDFEKRVVSKAVDIVTSQTVHNILFWTIGFYRKHVSHIYFPFPTNPQILTSWAYYVLDILSYSMELFLNCIYPAYWLNIYFYSITAFIIF